EGLGRFEGIPIFVPRSAPGDRLKVRLTERRPSYGRAEIVEVLEPGPGRRQPPCPYFERCGGCDLQHLEDDLQTELKAAAAIETLARLGGLAPPQHTRVVRGDAWAYRTRVQLHTAVEEDGARFGYFARRSHDLVAVDSCPICRPELERVLGELPSRCRDRPPERLDLAVGDDGRLSSAPVVEWLRHGEVSISCAGFDLGFDARCFFQAHRGLLDEFVDVVVGEDRGGSAYDLYAGVGLFSLPLAQRYERVLAVESDRVAARWARINARRNGIANLEVVARAVESWVEELASDVDRVVVDPPRAGLARRITAGLLARRPRRLTYVSCHPAAMTRDLQRLVGAYQWESLVLIDLFPQTGHIEAVAQLVAT
ncbi:MAG: methyltransferase, partial [Thermoanaerobaculia bacterium]|nr:methyltransferase [Thermoanaerobaculia bacterium]